jgi:hypothetical protein
MSSKKSFLFNSIFCCSIVVLGQLFLRLGSAVYLTWVSCFLDLALAQIQILSKSAIAFLCMVLFLINKSVLSKRYDKTQNNFQL